MTIKTKDLIFAVTDCPHHVFNRAVGVCHEISDAEISFKPVHFMNSFLKKEEQNAIAFSCHLDETCRIKPWSGAIITRHTQNYYWKHVVKRRGKTLKVLQYAYLNNCQGRRILIQTTREQRRDVL